MAALFDRARILVDFAAPPDVAVLALLADWFQGGTHREKQWQEHWAALKVLSIAAEKAPGYAMRPELGQLFMLHEDLQAQLALAFPATPPERTVSMVERTVEASTPWITSTLSFADALKIADHPVRWADATPQMTICGAPVQLPDDGALWRYRLKKETNFAKPLCTDLVSRETIDITAEGADSSDGTGGYRHYSYVLHSADAGDGLLALVEDMGWIELSGDSGGCQVRLYKRATVLRPVDDPLADLMQAAFMAELWMWATGFCVAAGEQPVEIKPPPLPSDPKTIPPPNGRDPVHVAVLGGGPAGLACAWLLSNPVCENGTRAWEPPNAELALKVILVEKAGLPGGKAASVRGTGANAPRIEEHGLHVLMGFYTNLRRILTLCHADDAQLDLSTVRVPRQADGPLADVLEFHFGPWTKGASSLDLEGWLLDNGARDQVDAKALALPLILNRAHAAPRPFLRAFLGAWQRVASIDAVGAGFTGVLLILFVFIKFLFQLLCLVELRQTSLSKRDAQPGEIAALATLLRWVARCAWGGAGQPRDVEMARELIELLTTIAIGLDRNDLFPTWAIADPECLPEGEYVDWIRKLQTQDALSLKEWLERYDVEPGFPKRSRILDAVTAGLFTTPDKIGAGTAIHGMGRLFLNYRTAPFKRLLGGTGEAVIGPIYQALLAGKVDILLGHTVSTLTLDQHKVVRSATYQETLKANPTDFCVRHPGVRPGWPDTARNCNPPNPPPVPVTLDAHAFVLAIPPFGGAIPGLPDELTKKLEKIGHCATVGLQSWATGDALFPDSLVSGIAPPLRSSAAMNHLDEGGAFKKPLYACGEIDDGAVEDWRSGTAPTEWLKQYAGQLESGTPDQRFVSVNSVGSTRYVSADPATQKVRPYVFETGIENLWFAGDWTRTALSCGSIEAAVTSGLEAAREILQKLGCTVLFKIAASNLREKETT